MIAGRHLQINWKLGLFTLLLLPLLLRLGFWQLAREQEKEALQSRYEQRMAGVPVSLDAAMDVADPAWLPVAFEAEFLPERSFLLDNRIHEGRIGVEVISPVRSASGAIVLLNRGWMPQGPYREQLPEISAPAGQHYLRANIYVPTGEPVLLAAEEDFSGWPRRIQSIDTGRMYAELGVPAEAQSLPYTLRLQQGMAGELQRNWQAVNTMPEKHRGYAVQWFSMAAALIILFVVASFPRRRDKA